MRRWIEKLVEQFDLDWGENNGKNGHAVNLSEDRATLLYVIDSYHKHLLEVPHHPVRKMREILDEFAKELMSPQPKNTEKLLFRFRQFFSTYRIDETTYVEKTFEDFKTIIWDFVDQLSEDLHYEKIEDTAILESLSELKDAVEANSIDVLRSQSRQFIDSYVEYQSKRDVRRSRKLRTVKKSLATVKKKLVQANESMRRDHLTNAYNRKSFDEQIRQHHRLFRFTQTPISLIMLDIDHFKKFNDTYGHAIGDYILRECVVLLEEMFGRDQDFVARIGGEEFAVILPEYKTEHALVKAEQALERIRKEVFVQDDTQLRFTVSMGIAELTEGEGVSEWMKRADDALYTSKTSGRNRCTVAKNHSPSSSAA